MTPDYLFIIASWMLVVIFTLTVHESAHAWMARRLGDPTAYHDGLAAFDPIPHIVREPIGMVVAPLITLLTTGWPLAWASVPVDPEYMMRNPRFSATVSLAGPLSNIIVAIVAGIVLKIGLSLGYFEINIAARKYSEFITAHEQGPAQFTATLLCMLFVFNVAIAVFNLIPLPPLDGSALPLFFLSETETRHYFNTIYNPVFQIVGLLIAWNVAQFVVGPAMRQAFRLLLM